MTDKIPKEVRAQFEDYAYRNYQAARVALALRGTTVKPLIEKKEFCKRDKDGDYVNQGASALWIGWKLCLEASAPWLERASLWLNWAESQDRVLANIPAGYSLSLVMEKEGFWISLTDPIDLYVEYEEPENTEEVGSLVKIIDNALAAAIAHAAKCPKTSAASH